MCIPAVILAWSKICAPLRQRSVHMISTYTSLAQTWSPTTQSYKGGRNDLPSQDTQGVSAETGLSETRVLSSAGGYQRAEVFAVLCRRWTIPEGHTGDDNMGSTHELCLSWAHNLSMKHICILAVLSLLRTSVLLKSGFSLLRITSVHRIIRFMTPKKYVFQERQVKDKR